VGDDRLGSHRAVDIPLLSTTNGRKKPGAHK
jgi:hypothetical protein